MQVRAMTALQHDNVLRFYSWYVRFMLPSRRFTLRGEEVRKRMVSRPKCLCPTMIATDKPLQRELSQLSKSLVCTSRCETRNHLWLVLEYCVGGDLLTLLKQEPALSEDSTRGFAQDLALALQHAHANGLVPPFSLASSISHHAHSADAVTVVH